MLAMLKTLFSNPYKELADNSSNTITSLLHKIFEFEAAYNELLHKYNDLVRTINKKGGQDFLDNAVIQPVEFDLDEIRLLIQLCHPDKHPGKKKVEDLAKKLIMLKEEKYNGSLISSGNRSR